MKNKLLYSIAFLFFCIAMAAQEVPVQHVDLPKEARDFLKKHFKSPFHHAIKDIERNNTTYEVMLEDNTEIEFTEAGRWKEVDGKGKAIPYSFIQKQVVDYVKNNNPKESIVKIELIQTGYEIELNNGLELEFDTLGTFVKID